MIVLGIGLILLTQVFVVWFWWDICRLIIYMTTVSKGRIVINRFGILFIF